MTHTPSLSFPSVNYPLQIPAHQQQGSNDSPPVAEPPKAVQRSKSVFYPKESAFYQYDGMKFYGLHMCFSTPNAEAFFSSITFTKEGGHPGIAMTSHFVEEMQEFLTKNDFPMGSFGSDCQFYLDTSGAHYYTYNPEVCIKLSKILFEKNAIDLSKIDKNIAEGFFNF